MIVQRNELNNLVTAIYDSSNILASTYDNATNNLEITFKAGTRYRYNNVTKTDYMRFELAESQGKIFSSHIKKYPNQKLEDADTKNLINEANELKLKEEAALMLGKKMEILNKMNNIIYLSNIKTESNIDEKVLVQLTELQTQLNNFFTLINKN
jgi:hypothetical protein